MNFYMKSSGISMILVAVLSAQAFANEALTTIHEGRIGNSAQGSETLILTVEGIREHTGVMGIVVYNSEAGRNSGQAVAMAQPEVDSDQVVVKFDGLAEGQYVINLFQDVNGDGKMNSNMFGIPTEPYAFSNNAKGNFGPAKWKDAVFTVGAEVNAHVITMFK